MFAAQTGPLTIQAWPWAKQEAQDEKPSSSFLGELHRVTADVLFFSGREEFNCHPEASIFAAGAIGSNARHMIYERCGHMPWIEAKEEFFRDLMNFVLSK